MAGIQQGLMLSQIDAVLVLYETIRVQSTKRDLSDIHYVEIHKLITSARAAITRITGSASSYTRQMEEILNRERGYDSLKAGMIMGVVASLKADIEAGYLQSLSELIHGELFADFLDMAAHLLDEGYKDPAAVVAGSALEAHLRQLCNKNCIPTEMITSSGPRSKKADLINSELTGASVYTKLDQKNVTAWLDLRNKAAHGKYGEYAKEQVVIMIAGVRDFITRITA